MYGGVNYPCTQTRQWCVPQVRSTYPSLFMRTEVTTRAYSGQPTVPTSHTLGVINTVAVAV